MNKISGSNALLITILALSGLSLLFLYSCGGDDSDDPIVKVTGVSLNLTNMQIAENSTSNLFATIQPSNATNKSVSWSSNNTDVVTVDDNGNLKSKVAGSAIITIKTMDGGFQNQCYIEVIKNGTTSVSVESVALNKHTATLELTATEQLTATIEPVNADNKVVIWSTDNDIVLDIKEGLVTPKKVGTATITVTTQDGGKTDKCTFTVYDKTKVSGITLNKTSLQIGKDLSEQLTPSIEPSTATNKNVTWSSDNNGIATVNSNGEVTGVAPGTTTVKAKTVDGGFEATCAITVTYVAVTSIDLVKSTLNIDNGATNVLQCVINPSNATNKKIHWASNNTSIVKCDANGTLQAVSKGTTTITATSDDNNSATDNCTVEVIQRVTSLTVNQQSSIVLYKGSSITITASVLPANANYPQVSWNTDNEIVKITTSGTNDSVCTIEVNPAFSGFTYDVAQLHIQADGKSSYIHLDVVENKP